jgi:polyferredoxin
MSFLKELNKNPSRRDLVEFGLIMLAAAGVFGALCHYRWDKPALGTNLWIAGGVLLVLALIPPIGRLLYIAWMTFGLLVGLVTSPIIMFAVYCVVILPVGLIFKVTKRDTMKRGLDPAAKSYWEDYPSTDDPGHYVRQF